MRDSRVTMKGNISRGVLGMAVFVQYWLSANTGGQSIQDMAKEMPL